jgi:hypothetical protein
MPPGQSGHTVYMARRSSAERNMSTDEPLGAKPYLCVSHEMVVTPGTRKSKAALELV